MHRKRIRVSDVRYMDRIAALHRELKPGTTLQEAAKAAGMSTSEASFLRRLSSAPQEIQLAIDSFDRAGIGLAYTAWREMASWSDKQQLEQLYSGRLQAPEIRADRYIRRIQ